MVDDGRCRPDIWTGGDGDNLGVVGFALGVGFTLCFATANAMLTRVARQRSTPALLIVAANYWVAFLCMLPLLLWFPPKMLNLGAPVQLASTAAILSGGVSAASLIMMYKSFVRMSFFQSNLIRTASAVLGSLIAWPFYPKPLSLSVVLGGGMLLISVFYVSARREPKKSV